MLKTKKTLTKIERLLKTKKMHAIKQYITLYNTYKRQTDPILKQYYKSLFDNFQKKVIILPHLKPVFALICSQEFCRKTRKWPLIYLCNKQLPIPLQKHQYIAGGAVLSIMLQQNIKDIDVFLTKSPKLYKDKLINYSKTCGTIVSIHAITITRYSKELKNYIELYGIKPNHKHIQIVKRIYEYPDQIIGGFDLDSCRFLMDYKGDIYTTYSGYFAFINRFNIINVNCQSRNFKQRITKYKKKGFEDIHLNAFTGSQLYIPRIFKFVSDYTMANIQRNFVKKDNYKGFLEEYKYLYNLKNLSYRAISRRMKDILFNIKCLAEERFDQCFIRNNVIVSIDEMLYIAKNMMSYLLYTINNPFDTCSIKNIVLNKIEMLYPKYSTISAYFETKNPCSQFTGSFHPTFYKINEIYKNPVYIDYFLIFPEIVVMYHGLKKVLKIKPIIYIILRNYFNKIILDNPEIPSRLILNYLK